jgi:hypothetical protein
MFKCETCKKVSRPGEKLHKHIVKTRNVTYYNDIGEGRERRRFESTGTEIVKEVNICTECHELLSQPLV